MLCQMPYAQDRSFEIWAVGIRIVCYVGHVYLRSTRIGYLLAIVSGVAKAPAFRALHNALNIRENIDFEFTD